MAVMRGSSLREIENEGFEAGLKAVGERPTYANPYEMTRQRGGLAAELYDAGFRKGLEKRDSDARAEHSRQWMEKVRREARERRERMEASLLKLFGDQDTVDDFVDMIKELIREETAPRSDY